VISVTLLFAPSRPAAQEAAGRKDKKALQGKWEVVSILKAGIEDKATGAVLKYIVFDGDKFKAMEAAGKETKAGHFKIDAAKSPKDMDVTVKEGDKEKTDL
jgi:uncharacterized protein (TIGR03067 family)